jgi:hypothetical protein
MRRVRLHARAESDLVDIWLYSFREWGEFQADEYIDELNAAVTSLSSGSAHSFRSPEIFWPTPKWYRGGGGRVARSIDAMTRVPLVGFATQRRTRA